MDEMDNRAIPFRPNLEGQFKERFYEKAKVISHIDGACDIERLVEEEVKWVEEECVVNIDQRRKYRAVWLLLRDLVRASWTADFYAGTLELRMPSLEYDANSQVDASILKQRLRSWMQDSRVERLLDFSEFIRRTENRDQSISKTKKPIEVLFADGEDLANRLLSVKRNEKKIGEVIKPYLQLIEDPNMLDEFTGIRLGDIWRYCRLTWSTPSESTPGRTLLYLIRDAAHPYHAIMGIASIENCAVQITCRDEKIGWNATSFISKLQGIDSSEDARKEFERLLGIIEIAFEDIDVTELCSREELSNPTEELVFRLQNIAVEQEKMRQEYLKRSGLDDTDEESSELGNISKDTENALFTRKRADQLSKLVAAKRNLRELIDSPDFSQRWHTFLVSDTGYSSIRTALVAQKTRHIGSSMMELNVCGAIPPYNEILGGKLVALLAMSPQVIDDYQKRYGNRRSEIASRLKNEDVIRPADLVFMGTTSLYYVGSSQYNRVKIPSEIFENGYPVEWKKMGMTVGFGTMHISKATSMSFNEVISADRGYNHFNHVFGEGASPKMRLMVQAIRYLLECSNEDSKDLAKHAMSRIVYGACLAKNTNEYLLGYDSEPEYYFDKNNIEGETQKIIDFWLNRWVLSRLEFSPIFDRIREFDKNAFLVSNTIKDAEKWTFKPLTGENKMDITEQKEDLLCYIRELYRGTSAYADNVDISTLRKIHVKTSLDEAIIDALKEGRDVILTGNAGDGKTHLIRILEDEISNLTAKPIIELDASTITNDELFDKWKLARTNKVPFCAAINGAVLYGLCEQYGESFEPINSATSQMLNSVYFGENEISYDDSVVVFDLSRRNVLSINVLKAVINSVCEDSKYGACANCIGKEQCDVHRNRKLLQEEIFIERLFSILCRVNLAGYHATLRELQAMVSYLIFGNRDCVSLLNSSGNDEYMPSELLYTGKGNLFDAIRKSFDPVKVSHPHLDEKIINADIETDSWVSSLKQAVKGMDPNDVKQFELAKRCFYFFNKDGDLLLKIHNDDVSRFQSFLSSDGKEAVKDLIRKLNAFFQTGNNDRELSLWEGFRYNNSPRRVLISRVAIKKRSQLKIVEPKLLGKMSEGIDVEDNYRKLVYSDKDSIALKVDLEIYTILSQAERGIPMLYIENNGIKRIWKFIELLTSELQRVELEEEEDDVEIKVLDVQDQKIITIDVERDEKKYTNLSVQTGGEGR